ncbi:androgen-dependent TFPI-regulating protein-like isoform X2 [Lineus longissimus]|uniref:androgen-dependent TFPI-regulating protein-like isoform X2 n=1 Tax=Lineus longissimus TaxID=88925 RepID=UPI002B4D738A
MESKVRIVFHFSAFLLYTFSVFYNVEVPKPNSVKFAGRFKYLTYWNLILQTVFFGLCVLNNIFGTTYGPKDTRPRSSLQKAVDRFYAAIAWPLGTFVVVTFWGIFAVNRDLVYPKRLDEFIPVWMNHLMHTTVLPILLVENYLVHHEFPQRKNGAIGTMGLASIYVAWIHLIAYISGHWVYPILAILGWMQRTCFIAALLALFAGFYILGEKVHEYTWKPAPRKPVKRSMKAH